MPSTLARTHVFISYAHTDSPVTELLYDDLAKRGIRAWIDKSGLEPGTDDWEQVIRDAIRDSRAVLFVASPESRRSRYTRDELDIAKMYGRKVYPVWVAGDDLMDVLPMGLGRAQLVDLRGAAYSAGLNHLTTSLLKKATGETIAPVLPPTLPKPEAMPEQPVIMDFVPRNPYKGLRAFTDQDVNDFFGRTKLIDQLIEDLRKHQVPGDAARFLAVVVGPSGSGKSSVVMAGLLPRLRNGDLPGSNQWVYLEPIVPGTHPLESLALSLAGVLPERGPTTLISELKDDAGRGLHLLARQIAGRRDRLVVLLIDQFEELFTLTTDEAERQRFIDLLITAVKEPDGALLVIVTLRADFYDRPLKYAALGALLQTHHRAILPLDIEDLRAVIEKPAALPDVRLTFDDGLVGDLLFEVRGEAAALPLLQFTLDQLFQQREGLRLTRRAYQEMGEVKGALAKHAETTYQSLPNEEHKHLARALFLRLIMPGATEHDTTRRRASLSELTLDDPQQTAIYAAVANVFVSARLLTTNKLDGEQTTIEVSHETLIREWSRLGDWLKIARDDIRLQKALAEDAAEWVRRGKSSTDLLYRGTELYSAEHWAKQKYNAPSSDEMAFITASARAEAIRKAKEAAIARRDRNFQRVLVVALSAVCILLVFAIYNANIALNAQAKALSSATRSEALRLALEADKQLPQDGPHGEEAALLSIRSLNIAYTSSADKTLLKSLLAAYTQQIFIGHSTVVSCVDFVPSTQQIVTGSNDATIRLWDTQTGKGIRQFVGHTEAITSIKVSKNGQWLLSGSLDNTVRLWEISTGNLLKTYTEPAENVYSVAFSPDEKYVLASSTNQVTIWELQSDKLILSLTSTTEDLGAVNSAAFSPDGTMVATGGATGTVALWNFPVGDLVRKFTGHTDDVWSVKFSADGEQLLTASSDKTARLWKTGTGEQIREFSGDGGHSSPVRSAVFSPDEKYILTSSDDWSAILWDTASGKPLRRYVGHTNNLTSGVFSPDGAHILTGSYDNTARLWDARLSIKIREFPGPTSGVTSVVFSANGKQVLAGSKDGLARLWDTATNKLLMTFTGHQGSVNSVLFAPDGNSILTGSSDHTIIIWDIRTGQKIRQLSGHTGPVNSLALSKDGVQLLSGSGDNTVRLWNTATGKELRQYLGHTSVVWGVVFSSDNSQFLSCSDDATARLWDIKTGQELQQFNKSSDPVYSCIFTPDGKSFITGNGDSTVRIIDLQTGNEIQHFAIPARVRSVAISADQQFLLASGDDWSAHVWNLKSGEQIRLVSEDHDPILSVAFAPDSKYFLTAGDNTEIRLWDTDYKVWVAFACQHVFVDLTDAERAQFEVADTQPTCPQFVNTSPPTPIVFQTPTLPETP